MFSNQSKNKQILIAVMGHFVRLRNALNGKNQCEFYKKLRARCKAQKYSLEGLQKIYGKKDLQLEIPVIKKKYDQKYMFDQLIFANYQMEKILNAYKKELTKPFFKS